MSDFGDIASKVKTRIQPLFRIEVNGTWIGDYYSSFIREIRVDMVSDGANQLIIRCDALDYERMEYVFIDDKILAPGNTAVVWMGYEDGLKCLGGFLLEGRTPDYSTDGISYSVRGFDTIARMSDNNTPRGYRKGTSVIEVAQFLCAEYGLEFDVEEGADIQLGMPIYKDKEDSDWDLLRGLAAVAGFEIPWTSWNPKKNKEVLHFRKGDLEWQKKEYGDFYPFAFNIFDPKRGDVLRATPRFSTQGIPSAIEVVGFDPSVGEIVRIAAKYNDKSGAPEILWRGTVSDDKVDEPILFGVSYQLRILDSITTPSDIEAETEKDALLRGGFTITPKISGSNTNKKKKDTETTTKKLTESLPDEWSIFPATRVDTLMDIVREWFELRKNTFKLLEFEIVGDPNIWPNQIHEFEGLGMTDSHKYLFTQIEHVMAEGGGYSIRGQGRGVAETEESEKEEIKKRDRR